MSAGSDVLLLVPFEPTTGLLLDSQARRTIGARFHLPLLEARLELEEYLGRSLDGAELGESVGDPQHRTLAAIALATHLERERLDWHVIDPGRIELADWRGVLARAKHRKPRVVGISTSFVSRGPWLRAYAAMVREAFPEATLLLGGYYYGTSARDFLSLDVDIYCVGEGELRLPEIVRAVKSDDRAALERIEGLYLRRPGQGLHFTGPAEALDLDRLPPPDWRLASRIEPPADLEADELCSYVETQRGCFFRCEFCTYRTLSELKLMTPARSLEHIDAAAVTPRGSVYIVDATATYTKKRWRKILDLLIARGGSRLPIFACARVADIDGSIAVAMAEAGVRWVLIGQESGDQRMLNLMKKGTKVTQVVPCIQALGQNGIDILFSFFHGFPGETRESIEATRSMIASLNQGFESSPVCPVYSLGPFIVQDFAQVSGRPEALDYAHPLDYRTEGFDAEQVCSEVLSTLVAVSKVPTAPVYVDVVRWTGFPRGSPVFMTPGPKRAEVLRWLKAVERGITVFVERSLHATQPDRAELRELKHKILARFPGNSKRDYARIARARARRHAAAWLRNEWSSETERGMGPATRGLCAFTGLRSTGVASAIRALRGLELVPEADPRVTSEAAPLADSLVKIALAPPKRPKTESLTG